MSRQDRLPGRTARDSRLARGVLLNGYAQATANQTLITAEVDGTSLTVTVFTPGNRRIHIYARCHASSDTAGDDIGIRIKEDGAQLDQDNRAHLSGSSSQLLIAECIKIPTNGSHTYKVTAFRNAGSGNMTLNASATAPNFIVVKDIGR